MPMTFSNLPNSIQLEIPPETLGSWQEVANLLAQVLDIPAALFMRLHEDELEVCASSDSSGNPYRTGDRETAYDNYCETVVRTKAKLLVPDARVDPAWSHCRDLQWDMVSYLGFPLRLPNQEVFGTLCVLDRKRNEYSSTAEVLMEKFRGMVEMQLELLYMNHLLGDKNRRLSDYLQELQALRGFVPICANCKSIRDEGGHWNPIEHYLLRHPEASFSHGICPECMKKLYPDVQGS